MVPSPAFPGRASVSLWAAMALLLAGGGGEARAMGTETHGNAPVTAQPEWQTGVVPLVNHPSRVYSRWVNGNESFHFRGDVSVVNQALVRFAAVDGKTRELILLPGAGSTRTFAGEPVAFDFEVDVPSGIYLAQAKREAGSTVFYREARVIAYVSDRGLDLSRLKIPRGITVLGPRELLAKLVLGLGNVDITVRGQAAYQIGGLPLGEDSIAPLVARLKDRERYVRLCAAAALGAMGPRARPALPALREALSEREDSVKAAVQKAMEDIEKPRAEPAASQSAAREAIERFLRSTGAR